MLKYPPQMNSYRPGDCIAISTMRALVNRRFALGARRILEICVKAKLAPISADALKAVELILFDEAYAGTVDDEDLAVTLRGFGTLTRRSVGLYGEARRLTDDQGLPKWRALAIVLYRNTRKKEEAAA